MGPKEFQNTKYKKTNNTKNTKNPNNINNTKNTQNTNKCDALTFLNSISMYWGITY